MVGVTGGWCDGLSGAWGPLGVSLGNSQRGLKGLSSECGQQRLLLGSKVY